MLPIFLCFLWLLLSCNLFDGWAADPTLSGILKSEAGTEFVYQAPTLPIKGVVWFAHGCSHSATDWWPKSKGCPGCNGLPVERTLVFEALRRDYVAVAQSSVNRKHKCWSDADLNPANGVLQWILNELNLSQENAPIHLIGASSGGTFVGHMAVKSFDAGGGAATLRITSAVIQIAPPRMNLPSPPGLGILFVHMARDDFMAQMISSFVSQTKRKNVREMIIQPAKLTPSFFYSHGQHLSLEDSTRLVSALQNEKLIDSEGLLVQDPRQSGWRKVAAKALPHLVPNVDSLVADQSGISELMNLAWAAHEITDENISGVFEFLKLMELSK